MSKLTNPLVFPDGSAQPLAAAPFLLGSRFQHNDEGTETGLVGGRTSQIQHIAAGYTTRVRFLYANWYMNFQTETNTANSITVKAACVIGGVTYPMTFAGLTTWLLAPGEMIWTDWLYLPVALGEGVTFFSRQTVFVANAAHVTPKGIVPYSPEFIAVGDFAHTTGTPGGATSGAYTFGPIAGQGFGAVRDSVAIYGDSIISGANDQAGHDYGYATRALAGLIGAINLSKGGASSFDLPVGGKRVALGVLANYAIYAFGQNDMANAVSFATVQANMQTRIDALAALGLKVIMVCIPPRAGQTTGGSDWSLTNQTQPNSNFNAGGTWEQLNAWIRSYPTNVWAVLDLNDAWAASPGSYKWHPTRVSDGIHPNTAGHDAARDMLIDFINFGGLTKPRGNLEGRDPGFEFAGMAGGYLSQEWYDNALRSAGYGAVVQVAGTIRLHPFFVTRPLTIDQISIDVTAVASSGTDQAYLAIYDSDAYGWPRNRLFLSPVITGLTAAGAKVVAVSPLFTFKPGVKYWTGVHTGSNPTLRTLSAGASITLGPIGNSGTTNYWGLTLAQAIGTPMPAVWTFAASQRVNALAANVRWRCY